jgi:hypothetical protein
MLKQGMPLKLPDIDYESIARALLRCFVDSHPPPPYVKEFARSLIPMVERDRLHIPVLPMPGETVAITFSSPKVAALAFDRVWTPRVSRGDIPADILVYGATELEIWAIAAKVVDENGQRPLPEILDALPPEGPAKEAYSVRLVADTLASKRGITGVALYDSTDARATEYRPGNRAVIVSLIESVALPDERDISWPQVSEFRRDSASVAAYRRFVHWLDAAYVGKSVEFIEEEIAERMDSYQRSLHKHGIETAIGAIEAVLDPAFLVGVTALLAGVSFACSVPTGVLAAFVASASKVTCRIARGLIDREAVRRGENSQIAFVHEIRDASRAHAAG